MISILRAEEQYKSYKYEKFKFCKRIVCDYAISSAEVSNILKTSLFSITFSSLIIPFCAKSLSKFVHFFRILFYHFKNFFVQLLNDR